MEEVIRCGALVASGGLIIMSVVEQCCIGSMRVDVVYKGTYIILYTHRNVFK